MDEQAKKAETQPAQAAGHQGDRPGSETQPAEEWGEGLATGKAVARGGKTSGHVPGATEPGKE